jgi:beta-lactamase regulating signal transducer with metallopeptidase domain
MTLISLLVKASALLCIAAIMHALFARRTSAATRHLIWTLAIVALLLLPMLSSVLPGWTAVRLTAPRIPEATRPVEPPQPDSGIRAASHALPASPIADVPAEAATTSPIAIGISWSIALPALYATGVFLLLARLTAERLSIQRIARQATEASDPEWTRLLLESAQRMGVRRSVRLLRSREQTMPMAFGALRGAILIPAVADTWSEDRRRAVLLHELAHVARYDCLTQTLAAVACALYWVHPGVWWIARRLRVERELACDDRVLSAGTYAREYAGHLLELAYTLGRRPSSALAVSMADSRQLEGRMLAVLDTARNRAVPQLRSRLAGLTIMVVLLIPVAAATTIVVPARTNEESVLPLATADRALEQPASQFAQAAGPALSPERLPGTWEIRPTGEVGIVHLKLTTGDGSHGSTIGVERLDGLSPAQLAGAGGPAQFSVRREAGTFTFEGIFRSGVGAGTYTFTPDASFSAELAKRGFEKLTFAAQSLLAREDIGFAFLDELTAQGYARPSLTQLVRTAQHGVSLGYLREMGRLGYRLGSVEALIAQRDHGVSPQFVRELRGQGLTNLTPDDLIRARDHGVSPEYISALRDLGYSQLSLETLVRARDHGISPEYVRDLRQLGHRLTLEELIKARDHGVSSEYIGQLRELGYTQLSLDALIRARDHGVSPEYIGAMRQLGYRVTLDELIKARDHGVSAEYIRALTALGYERVSLDDLIRLRDHGVTAQYVQEVNGRRNGRLTVDELVRLRSQGATSDRTVHSLRKVDIHAMLKAFVDRWFD